MEKYNICELNFSWEKAASHFLYDYDFSIAILELTSQFGKCEAIVKTLN